VPRRRLHPLPLLLLLLLRKRLVLTLLALEQGQKGLTHKVVVRSAVKVLWWVKVKQALTVLQQLWCSK
jgi:hypothetical protein